MFRQAKPAAVLLHGGHLFIELGCTHLGLSNRGPGRPGTSVLVKLAARSMQQQCSSPLSRRTCRQADSCAPHLCDFEAVLQMASNCRIFKSGTRISGVRTVISIGQKVREIGTTSRAISGAKLSQTKDLTKTH